MKKFVLLITVVLISICASYAREVLAPAAQFDLEKYKNYFVKSTDFKINLKSLSDYKITCTADIIGIVWGDKENIKIYDEKNEAGEIIDMKSTVIKTRYETYSYIRLYKSSREIVNLIVGVSPMFEENPNIVLGLCKLTPYKE